MAFQVVQFENVQGRRPVERFLRRQSMSVNAKVFKMINLLEKHGPNLGMPYSKKISGDLFELRISGRPAVRIFYTQKRNNIVFLHAFKKKTQKLPRKEVNIAAKRLEIV